MIILGIILGYFIGVITTLIYLMRKDKKKLEEIILKEEIK